MFCITAHGNLIANVNVKIVVVGAVVVVVVVGGGGGGVGVGVQSHFHVQPNYSVEVVLRCHWGCDNLTLEKIFVQLLTAFWGYH